MSDQHIVSGNRRRIQIAPVKVGGWTRAKRQRFLDELARTCNVRMATEAAGMRGKSPYDLRKRDPDFAALWREALEIGYERLEQALLEQALAGVNAIAIDPDREPDASDEQGDAPQRGHRIPGSGIAPTPPMTSTQAQIALALLNRYRGTVEGKGRGRRMGRRPTDEEVDAELRRHLDILGRQLRAGDT
ncbi:MAG: hypothetical protein V4459_00140 [Pseudomonadota bacterium]